MSRDSNTHSIESAASARSLIGAESIHRIAKSAVKNLKKVQAINNRQNKPNQRTRTLTPPPPPAGASIRSRRATVAQKNTAQPRRVTAKVATKAAANNTPPPPPTAIRRANAAPTPASSRNDSRTGQARDYDYDYLPDDVFYNPDDGGGYDQEQETQRLFLNIATDDEDLVDVRHLSQTRGQVFSIQRYGEWGRGYIIPESTEGKKNPIPIIGNAVAALNDDDLVVLYGHMVDNPRYGNQLDVHLAATDTESPQAVLQYLTRNFKGVGAVGAARVLEHFQNEGRFEWLRQNLIYHPNIIGEEIKKIINRKGAGEMIEGGVTTISRINTLFNLRYSSIGVRTHILRRLATHLSDDLTNLDDAEVKQWVRDVEQIRQRAEDEAKNAEQDQNAADTENENKQLTASAAPTASIEPALSDEECVMQIMADFERANGLEPNKIVLQSTGQPEPLAVKEPLVRMRGEVELRGEGHGEKDKPLDRVNAAYKIFSCNPYHYIGHVQGYGFKTADKIGQYENIKPNDPRRLSSIVAYALKLVCESLSHSYVDESLLHIAIKQIDSRIDVDKAIEVAINEKSIELDDGRYYPYGLLEKEQELSLDIAARVAGNIRPLIWGAVKPEQVDRLIDIAQKKVGEIKGIEGFKLDPTQHEAVKGILTSTRPLHVIVGGPGRGKTAIVQVIMQALKIADCLPEGLAFCAPVGKAAKVLTNQVKDFGSAKTIHSLLGAKGTNYNFEFNRDNKLSAQLIVADEQSMSGLNLAHGLFAATAANAHMILLGDQNQLQSIDSGDVLRSILALDGIEKYELKTPHRNDGQILNLVDRVNRGSWPIKSEDRKEIESTGDVKLYSQQGILSEHNIELFIQKVVQATKEYGGAENIGVICPVRKGNINQPDWNVTYLNEALREQLNPESEKSKRVLGTRFRLNDRVIITRNMRQVNIAGVDDKEVMRDVALNNGDKGVLQALGLKPLNVINGDTGYLREAIYGEVDGTHQAVGFVIDLDDGNKVLLDYTAREHLGHSYAITVHAAQGSEYEKVFAIVPRGHENFMHRHLLMTSLSRAKESLEVYGETGNCSVVASRKAPERFCGIYERAQDLIKKLSDKPQKTKDNDNYYTDAYVERLARRARA